MSQDSDEPDFIAIRCDTCQARLRIRIKLAGTVGKCPKCGASISIPHRPEIEFELPQPAGESETLALDGGYRLAEPLDYQPDDHPEPLPAEVRPAAPEGGYLEQLGRVRQQQVDKPPRFLFFSGVFDFPWYPEVWLRWVYLVLGGSAATLIPMLALAFFGGASGYVGIGLAFFAMPQIWITIWTGSFAAACGLQIFDDTAAGSDHVTGWPEPNWREWMWPLMYLAYVAAMVLALAYGIGLAIGGTAQTMLLTLGITEFILFPISLLSVMEANNLALLISPGLLFSLVLKPAAWLQFYLVTGVLWAVWFGTAWIVAGVHPLLLIVVNGLLYASMALIWFRLLGRLAWAISHRRSTKRRQASPSAVPHPADEEPLTL